MVQFHSAHGQGQVNRTRQQQYTSGQQGAATQGDKQQQNLFQGGATDQVTLSNSNYLGIPQDVQNDGQNQDVQAQYAQMQDTQDVPQQSDDAPVYATGGAQQTTDDGADAGGAGKAHGHHGGGHAHGKGKGGDWIPPGLAKKNAADLPDGNPWKAVLQQREDDAAQQAADAQKAADDQAAQQQQAQQADSQLMAQLMDLMQAMFAALDPKNSTPASTTDGAKNAAADPATTTTPDTTTTDTTATTPDTTTDTTTDAAAPVADPAQTTDPAPVTDTTQPAPPTTETPETAPVKSVHDPVTQGPLDDPAKLQTEIQGFNEADAGSIDDLAAFLNTRFPETSFTVDGQSLTYTLNGQTFTISAKGDSLPTQAA